MIETKTAYTLYLKFRSIKKKKSFKNSTNLDWAEIGGSSRLEMT